MSEKRNTTHAEEMIADYLRDQGVDLTGEFGFGSLEVDMVLDGENDAELTVFVHVGKLSKRDERLRMFDINFVDGTVVEYGFDAIKERLLARYQEVTKEVEEKMFEDGSMHNGLMTGLETTKRAESFRKSMQTWIM